jgi:hypothetical protein
MNSAVPTDPPISLHLLCCGGGAVGNHSCVLHAVFLQQPRFVNQSGILGRCVFSVFRIGCRTDSFAEWSMRIPIQDFALEVFKNADVHLNLEIVEVCVSSCFRLGHEDHPAVS